MGFNNGSRKYLKWSIAYVSPVTNRIVMGRYATIGDLNQEHCNILGFTITNELANRLHTRKKVREGRDTPKSFNKKYDFITLEKIKEINPNPYDVQSGHDGHDKCQTSTHGSSLMET